jgi:hypothetical protein
MTTAQQALSSAPFNPPSSVNHFPNESRTEEPTTTPIPYPSHVHIDPTPLPWRCQFTFSDGRQCRMPRHEFHVCLCKYHARREQELWGDPESASSAAKVYPQDELSPLNKVQQLEGLCDDLSTATAINRALAQVFRMLAQKRITQREAVAFGYLAQLLLQTIPGVRSEAISAFGLNSWTESLKVTIRSGSSSRATNRGEGPLSSTSISEALDQSGLQTAPEAPVPAAAPNLSEPTALNESAPCLELAPPAAAVASVSPAAPDYENLLTRSLDLFVANSDATVEGAREARRLLRDLERLGTNEKREPGRLRHAQPVSSAECALTHL